MVKFFKKEKKQEETGSKKNVISDKVIKKNAKSFKIQEKKVAAFLQEKKFLKNLEVEVQMMW